jgi:hypothetical protein
LYCSSIETLRQYPMLVLDLPFYLFASKLLPDMNWIIARMNMNEIGVIMNQIIWFGMPSMIKIGYNKAAPLIM